MYHWVDLIQIFLYSFAIFSEIAGLPGVQNATQAISERIEETIVCLFDGAFGFLEPILSQFQALFVVVVNEDDYAQDPEDGSV